MVFKTFWGFQREIKSFTAFKTEEEGSIDCKSQRSGRAGAKLCLLDMAEGSAHGLNEAVVALTTPVQDQVNQHSSMEWEGFPRSCP